METATASAESRSTRVKRQLKPRRLHWWIFLLAVLLLAGLIVVTNGLYTLRYTLAEDLYTSQHRYLAKYLVTTDELARIAFAYAHPALVNEFPSGSAYSDPYANSATADVIAHSLQVQTLHVDGFVAKEIIISHPAWVHLVSTVGGPQGRGLTLREAMLKYGAIAGINAGGFVDPGGDGNGGTPVGLLIENGQLVNPSSYLVGTNQVMGMTSSGQWFMGEYSTQFLLSKHVQYAIQFGPELIANGKILVSGTAGWGYAPRTVIGQMANGDVVFWVNDGRWGSGVWDVGASLSQVASILRGQGVVNAFNLDGGGSATMMIRLPAQAPSLVNTPDTNNPPYGMRFLPDAFLVIPPPTQ